MQYALLGKLTPHTITSSYYSIMSVVGSSVDKSLDLYVFTQMYLQFALTCTVHKQEQLKLNVIMTWLISFINED